MEWKNISVFRIVLSMWLLGVCSLSNAQELVPNGNFNYSNACQPGSLMNGFMAEPWVQWSSSPDFYHPCKQEDYSVPNSFGGGGNPFGGEGYVGIVNYVSSFLAREFISVELNASLESEIDYHIEFHISMMDSAWFATKNIGTLFTVNLPPLYQADLLDLEPQVKYQGADFLSNKIGWTKVEGRFTAQGGERYLTIGNFDTDEETDTLFIPGGGIPPSHSEVFWSQAHYYIDGVSVIPDSIYLGIDDIENEEVFNLYPNPNTGEFTIDHTVDEKDKVEFNVWSISGQLVARQLLSNGQSIIRLDVANGLYLYTLKVNGLPKWSGKTSVSSE
jgi:hypothetical protein